MSTTAPSSLRILLSLITFMLPAGIAGAQTPALSTMPDGLAAGSVPPVHARGSAAGGASSLAALLPEPSNVFSPMSTTIYQIAEVVEGKDDLILASNTGMESIRGDGRGGFRVVFLLDGVQHPVHFEAGDFGANAQFPYVFWKEESAYEFFMWSYTDSFSDPERDDGSTEFDYFDANGFVCWAGVAHAGTGYTGLSTYGARTMPAGLPDSATYEGRLQGHAWYRSAPGFPDFFSNTNLRATLTLRIDFTRNTISGLIEDIHFASPPAREEYVRLPAGNQIALAAVGAKGGRFSAVLTGQDTESIPDLSRSVAGFEGNAFIEFYGPAAEEVGVVLSAIRAEDGSVMYGFIGGRRLGP